MSTITPVRPSQEKYQLIVQDLTLAEQQLASFEVLAELEGTPAPDGLGYDNLLDFRYPRSGNGKGQVPRGVKLQQKLAGTRAVVDFLKAQLEAFNRAEEEYQGATLPLDETVGA